MKRPKSTPGLLCCFAVVALVLSACSQHSGKVSATNPSLSSPRPKVAAIPGRKSRVFHLSTKGSREVKRKYAAKYGRVQYKYANLWERLFDSYGLPDVQHSAIERELAWFINHPSYLDRAQQRAEPFLYNIVRQVERYGLPGEIALLPVVESAFQPHAVSPAKAAGIWQFIPSTGRHYGLKQSRSYDGRRDVYASTRAAIKYLKKLNAQFNGDWLLAVAAYNCGEGAVERAIAKNLDRNLPTDFWSLDLPEETRSYVPRLLAVSRLFADAERYGIDLRYIPNSAVFTPVKVSTQLDLALAADAADMSLDQLFALNPGFKRQFADVEGSYRLFIPAGKSKQFKRELARLANDSETLASSEYRSSNTERLDTLLTQTDADRQKSFSAANDPVATAAIAGKSAARTPMSDAISETTTGDFPAKPYLAHIVDSAEFSKPETRGAVQVHDELPKPAVSPRRSVKPAKPYTSGKASRAVRIGYRKPTVVKKSEASGTVSKKPHPYKGKQSEPRKSQSIAQSTKRTSGKAASASSAKASPPLKAKSQGVTVSATAKSPVIKVADAQKSERATSAKIGATRQKTAQVSR